MPEVRVPHPDQELLQKVNEIVSSYGCVATDLGPDSVGVQGDARVVGPCVFVRFPPEMSHEQIGLISTKITNQVKGITRVLMDITPSENQTS
ncbi:hypothetical protein K2Q00_04050 [Patescibacteria group bacterium]|nr:hypothetical protein [Patescibacteria group bacterium]